MRTNNQSINKLLNAAEKALKPAPDGVGIVNNHGIVTKGSIEGYIASFGANVINIDLLPTVAVYMQDNDRKKVIDAIAKTLYPTETAKDGNWLFSQLKNNQGSRVLKENIINASVALKIMIRTFEIHK